MGTTSIYHHSSCPIRSHGEQGWAAGLSCFQSCLPHVPTVRREGVQRQYSKRWGSAQRLFALGTCPRDWAFPRLVVRRTETQVVVVRKGSAPLSLSFRTSYFGCRGNFRLGMKGWGQPGTQGEGPRRRTWNPPVLEKWLPVHRDQGAWGAASCQMLQWDNELPETPCLEAARSSALGSFFMSSLQSPLCRWWGFFQPPELSSKRTNFFWWLPHKVYEHQIAVLNSWT